MSIPIIQRRRIEAELIKEIYDTLVERFGEEAAGGVIAKSVRRSAVAQARQFAEKEPSGTSLETFAELYKHWTAEDALTIAISNGALGRREPDGRTWTPCDSARAMAHSGRAQSGAAAHRCLESAHCSRDVEMLASPNRHPRQINDLDDPERTKICG